MKDILSFSLLCRLLKYPEGDRDESIRNIQKKVNWYSVVKIADAHFIIPLLYYRLAQKNLLAFLPEELQILLTEIHRLNSQRNELIYREINHIAALVNKSGIEPVFLKGSAALLMDIYDERGLRVMNDVDFLVDKKDIPICMDLMLSVGFYPMKGINLPADFYHRNPLVHDQHSIRFEIHERLDHCAFLDSEKIITDSTTVQLPDGIVRIPSAWHFAIHNILHHQVFNMGLRLKKTPLYQINDLYMISQKCEKKINWKQIELFFVSHSMSEAYYASINMLRKYFNQYSPSGLHFLSARIFMIKWKKICCQIINKSHF